MIPPVTVKDWFSPKSSIALKYALLLTPYFISVTSVSHFSPKFSAENSYSTHFRQLPEEWILYNFSFFCGIRISNLKSASACKCAFDLHENHSPGSVLLSFDDSLRFRSFPHMPLLSVAEADRQTAHFCFPYDLATYNTMNVEFLQRRIIQK